MEDDYGHTILVTPGAACEGEYMGWEPEMSAGPVKDYIPAGRPRPSFSSSKPQQFEGRVSFWMPRQGFTIDLEKESEERERMRTGSGDNPVDEFAGQPSANLLLAERERLAKFGQKWNLQRPRPDLTYGDVMRGYTTMIRMAEQDAAARPDNQQPPEDEVMDTSADLPEEVPGPAGSDDEGDSTMGARAPPPPPPANILDELTKARKLFVQRYQRTAWQRSVTLAGGVTVTMSKPEKEPESDAAALKKPREPEPPESTVDRRFWEAPGASARYTFTYSSEDQLQKMFVNTEMDWSEYELWVVPPPPAAPNDDDDDGGGDEASRRTRRRVGEQEEVRAVVERHAEHYATTEMEPVGMRLLLNDRFWQYPHFFRAGETTHVLLMPNRRRIFTLGISTEAMRRKMKWPPVNTEADDDQNDFARWGRVPGLDETWAGAQYAQVTFSFSERPKVDPSLSWTFLGFQDGTRVFPTGLLLSALAAPKFLTDERNFPVHVWPESNVPMDFPLLMALAKAYKLKPWYGMFSDAREPNSPEMPKTVDSPLYFVSVPSTYKAPIPPDHAERLRPYVGAIRGGISWMQTASVVSLPERAEILATLAAAQRRKHLSLADIITLGDSNPTFYNVEKGALVDVLNEIAREAQAPPKLEPLQEACTRALDPASAWMFGMQMDMPGITAQQSNDAYYIAGALLFASSPIDTEAVVGGRPSQSELAMVVCRRIGTLPEQERAAWTTPEKKRFFRGMAHGAAAEFFGRTSVEHNYSGSDAMPAQRRSGEVFMTSAGFFLGTRREEEYPAVDQMYTAMLHPEIFNQFLLTHDDDKQKNNFIDEWGIISSALGVNVYRYIGTENDGKSLQEVMDTRMWVRAFRPLAPEGSLVCLARFQAATVFAYAIQLSIEQDEQHDDFLSNAPLDRYPLSDAQKEKILNLRPDEVSIWNEWIAVVMSTPSRTAWTLAGDRFYVAKRDARPKFAKYRHNLRNHIAAVVPLMGTDNEKADGSGATLATGLVVALTRSSPNLYESAWRDWKDGRRDYGSYTGLHAAAAMVTLSTLDAWEALMEVFYPVSRFLLHEMKVRAVPLQAAMGGHWKFNITQEQIMKAVTTAANELGRRGLEWLGWKLMVKSGVAEHLTYMEWNTDTMTYFDPDQAVGSMPFLSKMMCNFGTAADLQNLIKVLKGIKQGTKARWAALGRGRLRVPPHLRGDEAEWTDIVDEMRRRAAKCMYVMRAPPVARNRAPLLPEWELMLDVTTRRKMFGNFEKLKKMIRKMSKFNLEMLRPTEYRDRPTSLQDLEAPATFVSCVVKNFSDHPSIEEEIRGLFPAFASSSTNRPNLHYVHQQDYYNFLNEGAAAHFGLPGYSSVTKAKDAVENTTFGGRVWGTSTMWGARMQKEFFGPQEMSAAMLNFRGPQYPLPVIYSCSSRVLIKDTLKYAHLHTDRDVLPLFDTNSLLSDDDKKDLLLKMFPDSDPIYMLADPGGDTQRLDHNVLSMKEAVRLRWTSWAARKGKSVEPPPNHGLSLSEAKNSLKFIIMLKEFLELTENDSPLRTQLIADCRYDPWEVQHGEDVVMRGDESQRVLEAYAFLRSADNETGPHYGFLHDLRENMAAKRQLKFARCH